VIRVRLPIVVLTAVAAFGAGALSSRFVERDAKAQPAGPSAAVYVPADGLTFRAVDGRVIARLGYDKNGGTFEVYDARERPTASLRGPVPGELHPDARRAAIPPAVSPIYPVDPVDPFAHAQPDLGY